MAHFSYQAQCPNGAAISGVIRADGFDAAMAELTALDLQAIQLTAAEPPKPTRPIGGEDFILSLIHISEPTRPY